MAKFAATEGLMIEDENPKKEETNLPDSDVLNAMEDCWFEHDHAKCIEAQEAAWTHFSLFDDDNVSQFFHVDDDVPETDSYTYPEPTEECSYTFQKPQKYEIPISPSRDRPLSPRFVARPLSPIHSSPFEPFKVLFDRYCKERKKKIKDMKKKIRKNKKNKKKMNKKKRLMRKI